MFQEVTRISKAIKEGLFHQFGIIGSSESAQNHKAVHLMGLLSDGGVQPIEHVGLIKVVPPSSGRAGIYSCLPDGRDVPPQCFQYIQQLQETMNKLQLGNLPPYPAVFTAWTDRAGPCKPAMMPVGRRKKPQCYGRRREQLRKPYY